MRKQGQTCDDNFYLDVPKLGAINKIKKDIKQIRQSLLSLLCSAGSIPFIFSCASLKTEMDSKWKKFNTQNSCPPAPLQHDDLPHWLLVCNLPGLLPLLLSLLSQAGGLGTYFYIVAATIVFCVVCPWPLHVTTGQPIPQSACPSSELASLLWIWHCSAHHPSK